MCVTICWKSSAWLFFFLQSTFWEFSIEHSKPKKKNIMEKLKNGHCSNYNKIYIEKKKISYMLFWAYKAFLTVSEFRNGIYGQKNLVSAPSNQLYFKKSLNPIRKMLSTSGQPWALCDCKYEKATVYSPPGALWHFNKTRALTFKEDSFDTKIEGIS